MKKNLYHFILLWASQTVSELGSAMTSFALILWAYEQKGTAMSTVSMAFFSYLPYVLISFAAGTLADRWKKKTIMLVCDTIAAMGSVTVLILLLGGRLAVWHLYLINLLIGCMNAFQQPASMVAVSLLTPERYYSNVAGMQAFSTSLVSILQPALATAAMAFGGLKLVLAIDFMSFCAAFIILAVWIPIPEQEKRETKESEGFWRQTAEGISYLRGKRTVWKMVLFFAVVNLLSSMAGNSLMPAMVLSRTGNNRKILGMVSSCLGIGTMIGGLAAAVVRLPRRRSTVIFSSCAVSFLLCDVLWGIGKAPWIWMAAAAAGNFPLPFLNAAMSSALREKIPVSMQGRAFSTQATFQFFTIPMGYLLGGVLADYVFEPFMAGNSRLQQALVPVVGSGKGSGMALIFLITGLIGFLINLAALRDKTYRELDS